MRESPRGRRLSGHVIEPTFLDLALEMHAVCAVTDQHGRSGTSQFLWASTTVTDRGPCQRADVPDQKLAIEPVLAQQAGRAPSVQIGDRRRCRSRHSLARHAERRDVIDERGAVHRCPRCCVEPPLDPFEHSDRKRLSRPSWLMMESGQRSRTSSTNERRLMRATRSPATPQKNCGVVALTTSGAHAERREQGREEKRDS